MQWMGKWAESLEKGGFLKMKSVLVMRTNYLSGRENLLRKMGCDKRGMFENLLN